MSYNQNMKTEEQEFRFNVISDEARFLVVAEQVLNEYLPAFEELAKEGDDD